MATKITRSTGGKQVTRNTATLSARQKSAQGRRNSRDMRYKEVQQTKRMDVKERERTKRSAAYASAVTAAASTESAGRTERAKYQANVDLARYNSLINGNINGVNAATGENTPTEQPKDAEKSTSQEMIY